MSTKCTIAYDFKQDWHLYEDALDDAVYIEAAGVHFEATRNRVTVELPPAIIAAIKAGRFHHERKEGDA